MKTVNKIYTDEVHYRRKFDQAHPPLDRLAATGVLNDDHLEKLYRLRDQVDIIALRERIESNIDHLWCSRKSQNATSVNIFDTLRKEEDNPLVTFSFEPSIPVR
jgi:hypothetical protein